MPWYRVEEREVREFLTMAYGDCIEALYMKEVQHPNHQSLFARIVFRRASTINVMLKGATKRYMRRTGMPTVLGLSCRVQPRLSSASMTKMYGSKSLCQKFQLLVRISKYDGIVMSRKPNNEEGMGEERQLLERVRAYFLED
ncbi:hypothetical protein Ahy_A03g014536 isoform C [Arachis hypogaea]|uniref:Uncharacterized protein n=1 Tax=Arachis hypogaea TaxID=3818 RepID=A0A445DY00_ARAHY|nr:hypothetical protein Ahy_A03g014536 isoform C [Arachis hypogaea]